MRTITVRKLQRLGLCPNCSFPFLNERIMLGQEYLTFPDAPSDTFKVRCGGCKNVYDPGPTVLADSVLNPWDKPRPLPIALFEETHDKE